MKFLLFVFLWLVTSVAASAQLTSLKFAFNTRGPGYDEGRAITTGSDGRILVLGSFDSSVKLDPASNNITLRGPSNTTSYFVAHYSSTGQYIRGFSISVNRTGRGLYGGITTDAAGNIFITGMFSGTTDFDPSSNVASLTAAKADGFIAKYDSTGQYKWAIPISGGNDLSLRSIVADAMGNVYATGYFNGAVDFDPSSSVKQLQWQALSDGFVAKYNSAGELVWAFPIGSQNIDYCTSIQLTRAGNILVTGTFSYTMDLDPGPGTKYISPYGNTSYDLFVAQYTLEGAYQWGFGLGSDKEDMGWAITSDGDNNVYVTGEFRNTVDFDPSSKVATLTSHLAGSGSAFIAKYNSLGVYQWADRINGYSQGQAISANTTGDVLLTGGFNGTTTIGSSTTVTAVGYQNDVFVALYKPEGTLTQAFAIGSANGMDECPGALITDDKKVFLIGTFERTMNVSLNTQPSSLTATNLTDSFVIGYESALANGLCQSLKSGAWNDIALWSCGRLPTSIDNVTIGSAHTVLLDTGMPAAICQNLEVLGTFSMQGSTITVNGVQIVIDQENVTTK